ncbi:MAG: hypothetical protein JWO31_2643, partial [Phycisphaerales bacterium]|nr:hypothetical protein [Phycisphaerales bacterium]
MDDATSPPAADAPDAAQVVLDELVSALRRADLPRAAAALASDGGAAVGADALVRLAELNARRRKWTDAAWLFDRAAERGVAPSPADASPSRLSPAVASPATGVSTGAAVGVALKRNFCRNMAALAAHRPALAKLFADLPPTADVAVAPSATGHATVAARQPDGGMANLSPGNRPLDAAEHAMNQLRPALDAGHAVGLAGVGDGYVLARLAADEPSLFLGMRVAVAVVEPDAQVALHALMVHDF